MSLEKNQDFKNSSRFHDFFCKFEKMFTKNKKKKEKYKKEKYKKEKKQRKK